MTNCTTKTPLAKVVISEISIQIVPLSLYFEIKLPYNLSVTQGNKTQLPDWQKESRQTFEETSGHVRQ
jgi:hypothetical protein